jgi:subfamily B ATP-binding cassette protein MsbA
MSHTISGCVHFIMCSGFRSATTHQTGPLLGIVTTDIPTIQCFASSSTLRILVDLLTIVSVLAVMFWLNWDFTLITVGVTPLLLLFVSRFKKAVKKTTHQVPEEQSEIVDVVQPALESMQAVKARLQGGSRQTGAARPADAEWQGRHRWL